MTGLSGTLEEFAAARAADDDDAAEAAARRADTAFPDHPEAPLALADLLVAQDRLEEAISHLETAVQRLPNAADLHFHLARALVLWDRKALIGGDVFEPYVFHFPWGEFPFPLRAQYPSPATPRAEASLRRCLELAPAHGPASSLLGEILLADEAHMGEAAERIQAGLQLAPDLARAHAAMGALALRAGQYPIAGAAFNGARERGDDSLFTDVGHRLSRVMTGELPAAVAEEGTDVERFAAWADGLHLVIRNPGILPDGLELARSAVAVVAERLIHEALTSVSEGGAMVGAARLLDKAMSILPGHPDAALTVGALMLSINNFEAAEANIENAGKLGSVHPSRDRLLALAQLCQGREVPDAATLVTALDMRKLALNFCRALDFENAETWLRRAIEREPENASAYSQLAQVVAIMGDADEAVRLGEHAVSLQPDDAEARLGLYGHYLVVGDPGKAWPMYESRLDIFRADTNRRAPDLPRWDGEDLTGKRLLVWREEGIGDEVLFASFLSDFMERWPCDVVFECSARLLPLLGRSLSGVTIQTEEGRRDGTAGADYHLPAGSLMMYVRRSLDDYAGTQPFLKPDPDRVAEYREKIAAIGDGPKIGLAWRSTNMSWAKRARASGAVDIAPLLGLEGVTYFNLQFDDISADLERLRSETGVEIQQVEGLDLRNDLDGVAAFLAALDGVVSSRGWIATFSGFVGQRTYCFSAPPNTYGLGQPRCPWAPAIEFFSRAYDEPWSGPINKIAGRIREDFGVG